MAKPITPDMLATGSEDGEQSAIFCWAAINLNKYPELKWLFAIPNGGFRNIITANKLKATGTKRGVSDMMLPVRRGVWPGIFIELKTKAAVDKDKKNGGMSEEQKEFAEFIRIQGYGFAKCVGWQEATKMLVRYLEHRGE